MIKHHRYPRVVILQAVYFKMRFTLGYWNVEELMALRGVIVDHSMIQRWDLQDFERVREQYA